MTCVFSAFSAFGRFSVISATRPWVAIRMVSQAGDGASDIHGLLNVA